MICKDNSALFFVETMPFIVNNTAGVVAGIGRVFLKILLIERG